MCGWVCKLVCTGAYVCQCVSMCACERVLVCVCVRRVHVPLVPLVLRVLLLTISNMNIKCKNVLSFDSYVRRTK